MGFMTCLTILLRRGMRLFLGNLVFYDFMTGKAEIRALRQKEFTQLRLVGTVTLRAAAIGEGRMLALGLLYCFVDIPMAGETQGIFIGHDHSLDIAGMGVMACQTISILVRHMIRAGRLFFHQIVMALGAQLGGFRFEQFPLFGAMTAVT